MRSRSAHGSSTPTSRLTERVPRRILIALVPLLVPAAAIYVVISFTAPSPALRILLRCLPMLPVAVWTIWFDRSRPLQHQPPPIRTAGRILLFFAVMAFVVLVFGIGLNWIYDPARIL